MGGSEAFGDGEILKCLVKTEGILVVWKNLNG